LATPVTKDKKNKKIFLTTQSEKTGIKK